MDAEDERSRKHSLILQHLRANEERNENALLDVYLQVIMCSNSTIYSEEIEYYLGEKEKKERIKKEDFKHKITQLFHKSHCISHIQQLKPVRIAIDRDFAIVAWRLETQCGLCCSPSVLEGYNEYDFVMIPDDKSGQKILITAVKTSTVEKQSTISKWFSCFHACLCCCYVDDPSKLLL